MTVLHTCLYCDTFQKSSSRNITKDTSGRIIEHTRFCIYAEKHVDFDGKPCSSFKPHPYIWCELGGQFIHILACINRQHREVFDCHNTCVQKLVIRDVIRGQSLNRLGQSARLHLVEDMLKPKLKLRKKCRGKDKNCKSDRMQGCSETCESN